MSRIDKDIIIDSPMYVHTTKYERRWLFYEESDILKCDIDDLDNMCDKIKYYRYKFKLTQESISEKLGIVDLTYRAWEKGKLKIYPYEQMLKLSNIYNIPLDNITDNYHKFIYNEQGNRLKSIRQEFNLSMAGLARVLGVSSSIIGRYENNINNISRDSYNKLMNYCKEHFADKYI